MRSAAILGKVAVPKINKIPSNGLVGNIVKGYRPCSAVCDALTAVYDDIYDVGVYATMWVKPHFDNAGEMTLGIIIEGDHYLFTGNNNCRIGDLTPGTVFALLNQRKHGAYPRDWNNVTPLIFAACEQNVPIENWRKFCAEVSEKLERTNHE